MVWNTSSDVPFLVFGGLSMCASVTIMSVFVSQRTLQRRVLMRMVFWMAFSDFWMAAAFFIPAAMGVSGPLASRQGVASGDGALCQLQGIAEQFFALASVSWYMCIVANAWLALGAKNVSVLALRQRERYYHAYVWGLSAATAIVVGASGKIGRLNDGACWIRDDKSPLRLLFYLPLIVYMAAAAVLLVRVFSRRVVFQSGGRKNRALLRMVAFVATFFAVWSLPLGMRLYQYGRSGGHIGEGWVVAVRVCLSGQGLANFCVWITSPAFADTRRHFAAALCCRGAGYASAAAREAEESGGSSMSDSFSYYRNREGSWPSTFDADAPGYEPPDVEHAGGGRGVGSGAAGSIAGVSESALVDSLFRNSPVGGDSDGDSFIGSPVEPQSFVSDSR